MAEKDDKSFRQKEKGTLLLKISLYLMSLWVLLFVTIILSFEKPELKDDSHIRNFLQIIASNTVPVICLLLAAAGVLGYIYFKDVLKNTKELPRTIQKCESKNCENLSFLITYIVPLMCFPLNTGRESFVLFFTILVIGILFIKTNLYYTNPCLLLLGFNVYELSFCDRPGNCIIAIVKGRLKENDIVKYLRLSDNIYFVRRM